MAVATVIAASKFGWAAIIIRQADHPGWTASAEPTAGRARIAADYLRLVAATDRLVLAAAGAILFEGANLILPAADIAAAA
jgi:hypothetical protein